MNYLECDVRAIKCLTSCLLYSISHYKKIEGIDMNDIESLREALRILRPDAKNLYLCDALIKIKKEDLAGAIESLHELLEAIPNFHGAKSLLLMTLFEHKDLIWKSLANEILADASSSKEDIEAVHVTFEQDWNNKGIWTKDKAQGLAQERIIRFENNSDINGINKEYENSINTMQPYSIRI